MQGNYASVNPVGLNTPSVVRFLELLFYMPFSLISHLGHVLQTIKTDIGHMFSLSEGNIERPEQDGCLAGLAQCSLKNTLLVSSSQKATVIQSD